MRATLITRAAGLACAILAVLPASGATIADVRAPYQQLLEMRKALAGRLQERWDKTAPQLLHLRAEQGADQYDLELTLKQSAGQWTQVQAWVPSWDQLDMSQYRQYFFSSGNLGAWVPRHRFAADAAALALKDGALAGRLDVAFKLDQTLEEKLPPGRRHNWWDRFEARGYVKDRPQSYQIDAKIDPASVFVEFFLEAAIEWPPIASPDKHNPLARSIQVRLQAPGTRFTSVEVRTPKWNNGKHEGLAQGVRFENGRLTGDLVVLLYSDSWFPNTSKIRPKSAEGSAPGTVQLTGKLLGRLPPVMATFKLDAKLDSHALRGTYKCAGDMGEFEGRIHGVGGPAVVGRYHGKGALPPASGMIRGMHLNRLGKTQDFLSPAADLPADDAQALKAAAQDASDLVLDIRALHVALQAHPLPLFDALAQMDTARPQWPAEGPSAQAMASFLQAALGELKSALDPDAKPPVFAWEDAGASPSSGSTAMAVADGANVFPAQPRGWCHAGAWHSLGPFEQRRGFEHIEAFAPDIVGATDVKFRQLFDRSRTLTSGKAGKAGGGSGEPLSWTPVTCGWRFMPPDLKNWDGGAYGSKYYAMARIASDQARKVWLDIGTYDYAKVWLNGKLLWTETRIKSVRPRPLGRIVAQAELLKGDNVILARLDLDRRAAWLTLGITADDPQVARPLPVPKPDAPPAASEKTDPPMACDMDKGTNVLWRDDKLGGRSMPLAHADRVYLGVGHDTLVCLDAATGKAVWSRRVAVYDPPTEAAYQQVLASGDERALRAALTQLGAKLALHPGVDPLHLHASTPVTDGRQIIFVTANGVVVAFDLEGKELWRKTTDLFVPQVQLRDGVLVVQGFSGKGWPAPKDVDPHGNLRRAPSGVATLKAADGQQIGRFATNRKVETGLFIQPRGSEKVYYLMNGFLLIDPATCQLALDIDALHPSEQSVATSRDTMYLTSMGWAKAILVWAGPDGRLAWRETWESNTDRKGYQDAPATVHNGQLWWWHHVVDHGPHCADTRSALYVADATSGAAVGRVKPVLRSTVGTYWPPVLAGDYMCFMAGGGHAFGAGDAGRMSMVSTDGQFYVAQPEMKVDFTALKPVFAGDRLFVRSRRSMACIAVKGDEGKAFQARELAAHLFRFIGPEPLESKKVRIEPANDLAVGPDVPLGELKGFPTEFWLGAGPFAPGTDPAPHLAALRPRIGADVTLNGKTLKFAPLAREHAANIAPLYHRSSELQGTGDSTPVFDAFLDPRCASGKAATGLFYTVLNNNVERVVKPAYYEDRMRGISVWVNGHLVAKDESLHLLPGLYPVMIRIDPDFYDRDVRLDEMPIDVAKAAAAKAVEDVAWPKAWRVLGPLPVDLKTLEENQLAAMPPDLVKVEGDEFEVHDIPARDSLLLLTGLMTHTKGVKSDWSKQPDEIEIVTPFVAYCYAQIDAPQDGALYVNAGADWFMRWYLDGVGVYDTMQTGNGRSPKDLTTHAFELPLKKGKHVICVMVKPGSKGWSLASLGAFSAKPKADLKAYELVRGKKEDFDYRFRPCFDEVPNPDVLKARYAQRLKSSGPRLKAVVRDLPGSIEARTAEALLKKLAELSKAVGQ